MALRIAYRCRIYSPACAANITLTARSSVEADTGLSMTVAIMRAYANFFIFIPYQKLLVHIMQSQEYAG